MERQHALQCRVSLKRRTWKWEWWWWAESSKTHTGILHHWVCLSFCCVRAGDGVDDTLRLLVADL